MGRQVRRLRSSEVNSGYSGVPPVLTPIFSNANNYWSSEENDSNNAYNVNFNSDGSYNNTNNNNKTNNNYYRCVKSM
ncbi:MAG: hypothetical protein LBN93_08325 [Candidatus Symbiothrix sp.]|nr:hypothetical protein [Candidatus Symbiothrix sp.]